MNVLLNRINAREMAVIQAQQNQECIHLPDSVPANSQKLGRVSISNIGPFFLQHITATFTTLETVAAVQTDTGIDYLRGKLIDGSNMRPLFNDYIPFSLFSTPGRRKSITGVASGSDSFQMQIIFPFEYLFSINADILMDVKNDSIGQVNSYNIAFWGIRIRSAATNAGL